MITECFVVLILTLLIAYLYLRRGRKGIALAVLPVAALPFIYLVGCGISYQLASFALLQPLQWQTLFVVLGVVVGGALLGLISQNINRPSARRGYLFLCGSFTVLFAFAIIHAIIPSF